MIDPSGIFYRNTKCQINSIISGVLQLLQLRTVICRNKHLVLWQINSFI